MKSRRYKRDRVRSCGLVVARSRLYVLENRRLRFLADCLLRACRGRHHRQTAHRFRPL